MKFGKLLRLDRSTEDKTLMLVTGMVTHGLKSMVDLSKFLLVNGILGVLLNSMKSLEEKMLDMKTQLVLLGHKFQEP